MGNSYYDLIIAGLGGQGSLTIGRLLAEAGSSVFKHSSFFPNYGPNMRGGECESTVIFSDKELCAATILNPMAVILMGVRSGANAIKEFIPRVKSGGIIIIDSLISAKIDRKDISVYSIPANEIAIKIGNNQVTNFVFLGAYLEASNVVPLKIIEDLMEERMLSQRKKTILELNKKALMEGVKVANSIMR